MEEDFGELKNWSVGIISGGANKGLIHKDLNKYP